MATGADSAMLELAGGDVAAFTGKAANTGDVLATKILVDATEMLALWLSNIVDLFDSGCDRNWRRSCCLV
jgi:hypothetical protein